jgi:fermentation-respiration switch protein FrsA (DUF1100 family)
MRREDVSFQSAGIECAGWLYHPDGDRDPAPIVIMAHGFGATRDQRLDAYAERFATAGIGALVFDYRHFGSSAGEPRQLLDIRKQHDDYRAALAFARSLGWVDPAGVALFGTSFSGGHVIAVGATDPGIAAIVSQCPFTDGLASLPKLGPSNAMRSTLAGLRDQLGALVGRAPRYMPSVGPSGTFAVMTSPDAEPGFASITPSPTEWENRVAARIALRVGLYRPGRAAAKLECPALFCVCDHDVVTPAAATIKYAARARQGQVIRYPVGHFDIYTGEAWEQAVSDQTEFLRRHLGLAPVAGHAGAATV